MNFPYQQRYLANGSTLAENTGRRVSIFVKRMQVERDGMSFEALTTDNQNVNIQLSDPLNGPAIGWIEVIGDVVNANTIKCSEIITFKDQTDAQEFDAASLNLAVMFWKNCKDIYQSS